jgi:transcriptional regulator with XRE-family HTH domain
MKLSDYFRKRHEAGEKITEAQLGQQIGLSQSQVSRIRNNLSRPQWETLVRLHEVTGGAVTVGDYYPLPGAAE